MTSQHSEEPASVTTALSLVERRSVGYVPNAERHGKPSSQFTLWFGANLQITAIVTGALAVVLGGDVVWSIIGLVIGQLFGGTVMALHSAQGPRLGLPQMISSRAQFGVYGAAIPLVLIVVMYIGFAASGTVLAGQAVGHLIGTNDVVGIVVFSIVCCIIAVIGYKLIHVLGKVATVVSSIAFIYLTVRLLASADLGALLSNASFTWPSFLLAISLSASWQIAYGPYVADYSRYLPRETSTKRVFFATFGGAVLGAQLSMTFGVLAAAIAGDRFSGDEVGFVVSLGGTGLIAALLYFVIALGKLCVNVLNVYGGFMSVVTTVSGFLKRDEVSRVTRLAVVVGITGLAMVIALLGRGNFLEAFSSFLLFLLTFFTPWSAINLIDFYVIARERYDVPALADPKGWYGAWNAPAIISFVIGIVIQLPFIATHFFTGPLVEPLGGADISWIVGLVGTAVVYLVLRRFDRRQIPERTILPEEDPLAEANAHTHRAASSDRNDA